MGTNIGCMHCCRRITHHGFIPNRKILLIAIFCILWGQGAVGSALSDRLNKLLRGPSRHGQKVARWNPDAATKARVRRALADTASKDYDGDFEGGYYADYYGNDNCPEHLKYQFTDIFAMSYIGPVCDIIDARNGAEAMKDLENCTVVNGFVHLVFMHDLTEEDLKKYRFPKLRVITQYLLIFRVYNLKTLRYMFPNLAVIGGQELLRDYALVLFENPQMKEVGLQNLQFILNGGVRIQKNPMMCYLTTINWERLGIYSENTKLSTDVVIQDNRDQKQCVDQCGDGSNCEKDGAGGRQLCWGLNICQKKLCPAECPHACHNGKCICHEQCLAGCTKPNDSSACIACRDKYHNGTCLQKCPEGTYLIHDWLCIQKEECQKLDWSFFEDRCQYFCPHGYQVNITDCMNICTKCTTNCGKVCEGDYVVSNLFSLRPLEACNKITGTLTISINGGSEVVERLDDMLKDVEELGSLVVRRSFPLVSLNFLRNVKRITGRNMEQELYSVYVLENKNLKELWNFTEKGLVIEKGAAFFHFNPHLCMSEVQKIERLTPAKEDDKDISSSTNGDKATCHFLPIKVLEVQVKDDDPFVMIIWENFQVKDYRTLIGYQVFYKESPEQNAKKNDGVDACRLNSWTIVDKAKSENEPRLFNGTMTLSENGTMPLYTNDTKPGNTSKLLSDLKPFTQYAYYIQAYTTSSADSGAASEIKYFTTKPDQPTQPRNLRSTRTTVSTIDITWNPPESPNGNITHYIIEWKRQEEEDLDSVRAINSCAPTSIPIGPVNKPSTPRPTGDGNAGQPDGKDSKMEEKKCECQCEKDEISKKIEMEVQESWEFENHLQNQIFFANEIETGAFYEPGMEGMGLADEADLLYEGDNQNSSRRKRSIGRRSSGVVNTTTSPENGTSTFVTVAPTTQPTENATTAVPPDPSFVKKRMIVSGTKTSVTLTDLHYFSEYNIQVYACNHASDPRSGTDLNYNLKEKRDIYKKPRHVQCSIEAITMKRTSANKTADLIPPGSVKVMTKEQGVVPEDVTRLYWEMPTDPNAYVRFFTIELKPAESENAQTTLKPICVHVNKSVTDAVSYDITAADVISPGTYLARIRPTSLAGDGNWSESVSFEVIDTESSDAIVIYIVFSVVAVFLIGIAVGAFVYIKTRKNQPGHSSTYEDYNPDYCRYVYIPDEYEIDIEKVTIKEEIGHGNFGKVFSGIAKQIVKGQEETKVAIKKLHENAMPSRRYEFLKEASLMKAFNAHHVVRLLGVVSQNVDPMVIMEFMGNGDLKSYLRTRRENTEENSQHLPPPSLQEKLQMAAEIADGMAYLAAYKFVHRDLAARNCLVDDAGTVKIGDFGLTRDIYENDYYRKESRGFLPIRWMAPESLKDGIFDSSSDVWSYGVVLWELATLAEQPYQGQQHDEVTRFVIDGGYMERPRNCPKRLYDLMTLCWQYNPKMRPVFLEIVQELYVDVNDDFKEVCFYGKHDQVGGVVEEDEGQFLLPHDSNSDGTEALYPHHDGYYGGSSGRHQNSENHVPLQPSWNSGNHTFKPQKNSVKNFGRVSSTPPRGNTDEKQGLLTSVNDEYPPSSDNRSLNTTSTTAPRTPPLNSRTKRDRYSSESLYENDSEDDTRKHNNARDSGTYISTNRTPKIGDKDPLVDYKHLNGSHKKSPNDFELDLESGVDEGMWGNSSTASASNPSTPTEMHAMLPSDGHNNDNSVTALMTATASSNC